MPARFATVVAVAAALAVAAVARPAEARPLTEAVIVEDADPCLTVEALVDRLAHWLGRDELDDRLLVMVLPKEGGADFVLHRDGDRTAVRRFPRLPADCDERVEALSLAIALALDATLLEALAAADGPTIAASRPAGRPEPAPPEPTPEPTTPEPTPPEPPPPEPTPPAPEEEPPAMPGPAFVLSGGLEGRLGVDPTPWIGVELDLEVVWPTIALEVGAVASPEVRVQLGGGSVDLSSIGGRGALCFRHAFDGTWALRGCGTVSAGTLRGVGVGFDEVRAVDLPWLSIGARLSLRARIGILLVSAYVEPRVAVVQPEPFVQGRDGERLHGTSGEVIGLASGLSLGAWFR